MFSISNIYNECSFYVVLKCCGTMVLWYIRNKRTGSIYNIIYKVDYILNSSIPIIYTFIFVHTYIKNTLYNISNKLYYTNIYF